MPREAPRYPARVSLSSRSPFGVPEYVKLNFEDCIRQLVSRRHTLRGKQAGSVLSSAKSQTISLGNVDRSASSATGTNKWIGLVWEAFLAKVSATDNELSGSAFDTYVPAPSRDSRYPSAVNVS